MFFIFLILIVRGVKKVCGMWLKRVKVLVKVKSLCIIFGRFGNRIFV